MAYKSVQDLVWLVLALCLKDGNINQIGPFQYAHACHPQYSLKSNQTLPVFTSGP